MYFIFEKELNRKICLINKWIVCKRVFVVWPQTPPILHEVWKLPIKFDESVNTTQHTPRERKKLNLALGKKINVATRTFTFFHHCFYRDCLHHLFYYHYVSRRCRHHRRRRHVLIGGNSISFSFELCVSFIDTINGTNFA